MKPLLSVIIPWRNRPELGATLKANLAFMAQWDCEVLIVNYGGDAQILADMLDSANPILRLIEVRVEGFNKSRALNIGTHFARGQYCMLLDSDVILTDFNLPQAMEQVDGGAWVILKQIRESAPMPHKPGSIAQFANIIELVLNDQRTVRVETKRSYFDQGARSCPGIMLLKHADLLAVGGFNSLLVGWGWEDIDLHVRLGLVLQRHCAEFGEGIHMSHGNECRHFIGSSPDENNYRNQQICMARYNAGEFLGTYQQDTAAFRVSAALLA